MWGEGVHCCTVRKVARGRDRDQPDASTRVRHRGPRITPAPAPATGTSTHTVHLIARPGRGNRRSAALAGCAQVAPECTVRRAATTGGVPANCAAQPSMPYASPTRFHINLSVPKTGQLHATIAADRLLKQATQCITKNLLLAGCLNRHHSTKQLLLLLTLLTLPPPPLLLLRLRRKWRRLRRLHSLPRIMLRLGSGLQLLPQVVREGNAQGGGGGSHRDRTQGGGQGLELGGLAPQGQDAAPLEVEPLPCGKSKGLHGSKKGLDVPLVAGTEQGYAIICILRCHQSGPRYLHPW